jgi:hypothetical protein
MEFVPDRVLGGYGRGTGGYCRGVGNMSCMIDHGCLGANKRVSPFPRDFDNNLVFKNVFQQRYRDVV